MMVEGKSSSRASTSKPTQDDIQAQLDQLRGDIAGLAKMLGEMGSQKASEARSKAGSLRDGATKAGQDAYARAREEALSIEEDLEGHIRARPVQSVLIAASIGFLAAFITRR